MGAMPLGCISRLVSISALIAGLAGPVMQLQAGSLTAGTEPLQARDRITLLNQRLDAATTTLAFEPTTGYLRPVLEKLGVPVESQVMVFSPTSSHGEMVSPDNPRAIYFNDNVAIGWVRGSSVIEAAGVDPERGVVFYTLDQSPNAKPRFRENRSCLTCHQSDLTSGVPGLLVLSTGTRTTSSIAAREITDHRTPLTDRWGGWYVTGISSRFRHEGNRIGQGWLKSLYDQFMYTSDYPAQYSDIVALMTLEHQARATNLIVKAAAEARRANSASNGNLQQTIKDLSDYLMFANEASLPARIIGTSGFAEKFAVAGQLDSKGRSLRQFDLSARMMRYPCSFMIYSDAFGNLPLEVRTAVYTRIWEILTNAQGEVRYPKLPVSERKAIAEILRETKQDLPSFFQPSRF